MSGGSYDYLCFKDAGDLMTGEFDRQLERMAKRLGPLDAEAEQETLAVLAYGKAFRAMVDKELARGLDSVWQAVEWLDSGDWDDGELRKAVAEWHAKRESGG